MVTTNTRSLILGRCNKRTIWWCLVASELLLVSLLYFAAVKVVISPTIHRELWWEGYVVCLILLIAVQAFSNEGILVSWLLAFAAAVGFVMNNRSLEFIGENIEYMKVADYVLLSDLSVILVVGTLGFLIGATIRRMST